MDTDIILSKQQKDVFKDPYYPYLCMITYESGEVKIEAVNSLDKANYLLSTSNSGMTDMLSVTIFARLT